MARLILDNKITVNKSSVNMNVFQFLCCLPSFKNFVCGILTLSNNVRKNWFSFVMVVHMTIYDDFLFHEGFTWQETAIP